MPALACENDSKRLVEIDGFDHFPRFDERSAIQLLPGFVELFQIAGDLVGAMLVDEADEVLVVMESGKVMRSPVSDVPAKGKNTMGVIFTKPSKGDRIIGIARNVERNLGDDEVPGEDEAEAAAAQSAAAPRSRASPRRGGR